MTGYTTFREIEPLATEYLLAGYPKIPRGDVTGIFGDGGVGKGRMITSFIAQVVNEGATVITVLPEDHPGEQVRPRLEAAGVADMSRVVDMTRLPGGGRFKLSADMRHDGHLALLREAIETLNASGHDVRLVVIDPVAAVIGWGSINTNQGARRVVEGLQDMAADTGVAVILVAHTVKSGQLQGSAGLEQALRLLYRVGKDPANPLVRVVSVAKANNLASTEDLKFTVEQGEDGQVRVIWLDRAEQDRRNKSWRQAPSAAAAGDGLAGTLAGIRQLGQALRDLPGQVTVTTAPPGQQYAALVGVQRPGQDRPAVTVLDAFPADDLGARRARAACEAHPQFRPEARWQQGRDGGLLSKYQTGDGTVVRFAVTAVAG